MENNSTISIYRPTINNQSALAQIAQHVSQKGEPLNINNLKKWLEKHNQKLDDNGKDVVTVLCK